MAVAFTRICFTYASLDSSRTLDASIGLRYSVFRAEQASTVELIYLKRVFGKINLSKAVLWGLSRGCLEFQFLIAVLFVLFALS